jgi:hypothetical protein
VLDGASREGGGCSTGRRRLTCGHGDCAGPGPGGPGAWRLSLTLSPRPQAWPGTAAGRASPPPSVASVAGAGVWIWGERLFTLPSRPLLFLLGVWDLPVLGGPVTTGLQVQHCTAADESGMFLSEPWLVPQFSPNFTMQKEDSPSHQNVGKCMEY